MSTNKAKKFPAGNEDSFFVDVFTFEVEPISLFPTEKIR